MKRFLPFAPVSPERKEEPMKPLIFCTFLKMFDHIILSLVKCDTRVLIERSEVVCVPIVTTLPYTIFAPPVVVTSHDLVLSMLMLYV